MEVLSSCISFIDGSLVKIQKPWNNKAHKTWFYIQKIYAMNNIIIFYHMDYSCAQTLATPNPIKM